MAYSSGADDTLATEALSMSTGVIPKSDSHMFSMTKKKETRANRKEVSSPSPSLDVVHPSKKWESGIFFLEMGTKKHES